MFIVREHFPAKYQNVTEVEGDKAESLLDVVDCAINMLGFNKLKANGFYDCSDEVVLILLDNDSQKELGWT